MNHRDLFNILSNHVLCDYELSDMGFSSHYIYIDGGGAIYRHLKWEIYGIFRRLKNIEFYEGSLSSFERLRITESILEELV
jgi:hypothetical protein